MFTYFKAMEKRYRLKRSEAIANVVQGRKKAFSDCFIIYYKITDSPFKVAFSVSKKYGHAFERNYAKRVTREIFKSLYNMEDGLDMVIVIKEVLKHTSFESAKMQMKQCLDFINKKKNIKDK